ncbi:gag-pol polyprotein [Cucumis melo var. makuwa]|uniref:Gag-pol polyprotein n=1 Tax=Cucumis melo var. makuwa TaxID=1194695 RepID=A0A5A7V6X7_CUCMM|nr:gag-pol polyprotein [Cucumis melo var. makuwa]
MVSAIEMVASMKMVALIGEEMDGNRSEKKWMGIVRRRREGMSNVISYSSRRSKSGCLWHMIGNASFFSVFMECNASSVIFGDEEKGKIINRGTIDQLGLPYLLDVHLVKGLSANLISINQLCDQGYLVSFSKNICNVINNQNQVILNGTRLSNNCYHWDSERNMCNLSKTKEANLWHKRLGHISGSTISKTINVDVIMGLPVLSFDMQEFCSGCSAGKHTKLSHKSTTHHTTSRTLELLYIDLMESIKTENLGGKLYAMVYVDDFSLYTWIKFVRDKSETFKVCPALYLQLQ